MVTRPVRSATELAAAVRAAREQQGLTQAELAERIGVSRFWVVAFEKGKESVELGTVLRALTALGLRLDLSSADPGTRDVASASDHETLKQLGVPVIDLGALLAAPAYARVAEPSPPPAGARPASGARSPHTRGRPQGRTRG